MRRHHPPLILIAEDFEDARELKANPATKHIPVLALTAHAFDDARQEARAVGCDGFVTKPCLPDDLVTRVRAFLDAAKKTRRL